MAEYTVTCIFKRELISDLDDQGPLVAAEIRVKAPLTLEQKSKATQVLGASIIELAKVPGFFDNLPMPEQILSREKFNEMGNTQRQAYLLDGGQLRDNGTVLIPAGAKDPANVLDFNPDLLDILEEERIREAAELIADVLKSEGHQSAVVHEAYSQVPNFCD